MSDERDLLQRHFAPKSLRTQHLTTVEHIMPGGVPNPDSWRRVTSLLQPYDEIIGNVDS